MPGKGPLFQKLDSSEGTFGWFLHSSNKASIKKKFTSKITKKENMQLSMTLPITLDVYMKISKTHFNQKQCQPHKMFNNLEQKNSSLQALPKFFTYTIVLHIILSVGSLPITINPVYDNSSNRVFSQIIQNLNSKCRL